MIIRKAAIKDFEKLKEIKILSKKEELKYSDTLKSLGKNKEIYFSYLKKDLMHKNRSIFIALENKKVIGMVLAQCFEPLPISKFQKKGYISNLYVLKGSRKRGIGKKLVIPVLKWLKEKNVGHITLEIHVNNKPAIKLYRRLGFEDYTIKLAKKI